MALADHSGTRIAFVPEAEFGVTPATPNFKIFRTTRAAGLRTNKQTGTSEEIRADGNVTDEFLLGLDSAGDYPVELSYGSFDEIIAALMRSTWSPNVIKNGADALQSFTVEETRELGATDSFSRFTGVTVNQGQFTVNARAKIEATFGFMGIRETLAEAPVAGATYEEPNAEPVLTSSAHVAALSIAGVASPKIRNLSFTVNRNLRVRPQVTSPYSLEFGAGKCDVTGTFEAYFESNELYQKVLDHGGGALSFTAGAAANKTYKFDFPKIIFLDGNIPAGGNSDDVMVTVPFRAVLDATEACSIKITRAVA